MLGDLDVGLHLVRTQALRAGEPLSTVTARLVEQAGLAAQLLPATDDRLRTFVVTQAGTFAFQDWFVTRRHADEVDAVEVRDADDARAAPGVLDAFEHADLLVVAPSNPYVSIGPILAVAEIREALAARDVPCVAVSPLIGGRAVKGPLDRMLTRMSGGTSPRHLAERYAGLIDTLVIDAADAPADADVRLVVSRDPDGRPCRRAAARARRARGGRVRIAVVGGTGSFGQALAKRLVDVGLRGRDRLARRRAGGGGGRELGAEGATNADACRSAELVVLATKADAALETARELRDAIGATTVLSVAAELSFTRRRGRPHHRGDVDRRPDPGGRRRPRGRRPALARRAQPRRRRGARRGRARLRRRSPTRRRSCSSSPSGSRRAARSTAARSRRRGRSRVSPR